MSGYHQKIAAEAKPLLTGNNQNTKESQQPSTTPQSIKEDSSTSITTDRSPKHSHESKSKCSPFPQPTDRVYRRPKTVPGYPTAIGARPLLTRAKCPTATGEHKDSREHEGPTHRRRDGLGPDHILASFRNNKTEKLLQKITGLDSLSKRLNKLQYVLVVLGKEKTFQATDQSILRVMQTFHQQLKVWVRTGKTEPIDNLPRYIGTLLHRAGKLVKRFSPAEKLEALRAVDALLATLKSRRDLDAQAIANALLGAGYLANKNHLTGTLPSASIEALLTTLKNRRDLHAQAIANALLGAGYLANKNHLTGTLSSASMTALLSALEGRRDATAQDIANALLGVGYLKEQSQPPHTRSHLSQPQAPRPGSGSFFSCSHQQSRLSQDHFREKKETPDLTAQHGNRFEMTHPLSSSSLFSASRNGEYAPCSYGGMWSHDSDRQRQYVWGDAHDYFSSSLSLSPLGKEE